MRESRRNTYDVGNSTERCEDIYNTQHKQMYGVTVPSGGTSSGKANSQSTYVASTATRD